MKAIYTLQGIKHIGTHSFLGKRWEDNVGARYMSKVSNMFQQCRAIVVM